MLVFLTASFGPSQAGLATVGYAIKTADGQTTQTRTTTGVVDLGAGTYGVEINLPDSNRYFVQWDTGGQAPRYASNTVDTSPVEATTEANVDFKPITLRLDAIEREVQGLKEKNQRRTVDNPADPALVTVDIKKDEANDWSATNLVETWTVPVVSTENGDVERYGG